MGVAGLWCWVFSRKEWDCGKEMGVTGQMGWGRVRVNWRWQCLRVYCPAPCMHVMMLTRVPVALVVVAAVKNKVRDDPYLTDWASHYFGGVGGP